MPLSTMVPLFLLLIFSTVNNAAKGDPPRIDEKAQTKFRVPVGTKQLKLVCPILPSEHNIMVQWSKDGESVDLDEIYKIARDNREIRFKNLKFEDSGRFECKVINGFGHVRIEFVLQVYGSPPYWVDEKEILTTSSAPVRVHLGGKLQLRCAAKGNPVPELRWFKNDHRLPSIGPIDSALLTVDGIKEEDAGTYRCEVTNKLGNKHATFKVLVGDFFDADEEEEVETADTGPIPIIDHPYNVSVSIGRTAQFVCKAKAEDTPLTKVLIRWLKELTDEEYDRMLRLRNATIVHANDRNLMVIDDRQFPGKEMLDGHNYFTNRLIIPSTEESDEGRYICVVTDAAGQIVYRTAELYILRGLRVGDLHLYPSTFWWIAIPLVFVFILFVVFAVMYLKASQKEAEKEENKCQPPPPRIPRPVTPGSEPLYGQQPLPNLHHPHYLDPHQSPLLLHSGLQSRGTIDRLNTPHRLHRGIREDEMLSSPHFHQHSSQSSPMYWGNSKSSNQPLLMTAPHQMIDQSDPHRLGGVLVAGCGSNSGLHHSTAQAGYYPSHYAPSSNYRTLDLQYCRDPNPSLYSSDYIVDHHSPFSLNRSHDL